MDIDAKIYIQINGSSSFCNNRYKVYLNDNFVGNLNYKKHKVGVWTKTGNQKILVKRKDFEKDLELNITSRKKIMTVNIDESSSVNYSPLLKGLMIGVFITFFAVMIYRVLFTTVELNAAVMILFLILTISVFSKSKEKFPFDLNVKNA